MLSLILETLVILVNLGGQNSLISAPYYGVGIKIQSEVSHRLEKYISLLSHVSF